MLPSFTVETSFSRNTKYEIISFRNAGQTVFTIKHYNYNATLVLLYELLFFSDFLTGRISWQYYQTISMMTGRMMDQICLWGSRMVYFSVLKTAIVNKQVVTVKAAIGKKRFCFPFIHWESCRITCFRSTRWPFQLDFTFVAV